MNNPRDIKTRPEIEEGKVIQGAMHDVHVYPNGRAFVSFSDARIRAHERYMAKRREYHKRLLTIAGVSLAIAIVGTCIVVGVTTILFGYVIGG